MPLTDYVSRFDRSVLDDLVKDHQLGVKSKNFLIQSLDPFHDTQIDPVGFPDATNGNSFIQNVTLTKTFPINTPTDFHIFSLPQLGTREVRQVEFTTPVTTENGGGTLYGEVGPLNVVQVKPGFHTMPFTDSLGQYQPCPTPDAVDAFDLAPFLVGDNRLVSLGFEVHNTGPELLKSGAIVTYRAPQTCTTSFMNTDPFGALEMRPICRSNLPPSRAGDALLLAGSEQWEAKDGAYVVNTLSEVSNPAIVSDYRDQLYFNDQTVKLGSAGWALAPLQVFPSVKDVQHSVPFNTAGAFATGCAQGSVLTVILKAYIECFPTPDLKSYITLTTPSTPYDPVALQIYSAAAYRLKPGTKVDNNAGGDYWRSLKEVLREVAPRVHKVANVAEGVVRVGKGAKRAVDNTKTFGKNRNVQNAMGKQNVKR